MGVGWEPDGRTSAEGRRRVSNRLHHLFGDVAIEPERQVGPTEVIEWPREKCVGYAVAIEPGAEVTLPGGFYAIVQRKNDFTLTLHTRWTRYPYV